MNNKVKKIFFSDPMISSWGARKFGRQFVGAKLYPLERKFGSFKCNGKR